MKNLIILICVFAFCFSNCKTEFEEFAEDFRVPNLNFELDLKTSQNQVLGVCPFQFFGFVEFATQSIYATIGDVNNLFSNCQSSICVEYENGYFAIRSSELKICTTETVTIYSDLCSTFQVEDVVFIQSSGFTEIRCYMSSQFWECWFNPATNQQGYYSIWIFFEHANPFVI